MLDDEWMYIHDVSTVHYLFDLHGTCMLPKRKPIATSNQKLVKRIEFIIVSRSRMDILVIQ